MPENPGEALRDLGELQREVLQIVLAGAPISAEAVRERLGKPLKESTVRTVLHRLEQKGYLAHSVEGRTYLYAPVEQCGRMAAQAVQGIVDWLCNGSVKEILVGMVDANMIDQEALRLLGERLRQREQGVDRDPE